MLAERNSHLLAVVCLSSLLGCSGDGSPPTQPTNRPPQLSAIPDQQIFVGIAHQEPITATDPDGDPIHFRVTQSSGTAPEFIVDIFDVQQSGTVATATCEIWSQVEGSFTATVGVSDFRGGSDEQSFSIVVETLTFDPLPPSLVADICLRGDLVPPITVEGEIDSGDCPPDILGHFESWRVRVVDTSTMTFAVDSQFDSYLQLVEITNPQDRSTWDFLADDDDSGGNLQARLSYRLEEGHEYVIAIAGYSAEDQGSYSLQMWD